MSNISLLYENLLLTWNDKPIVAQRFLMSQLERLALETCQLAGKHAGKQMHIRMGLIGLICDSGNMI